MYLCTRFRRREGDVEKWCRGREELETDERIEIACVKGGRDTAVAVTDGDGHEDESMKVKTAILTMKSLILAQDER